MAVHCSDSKGEKLLLVEVVNSDPSYYLGMINFHHISVAGHGQVTLPVYFIELGLKERVSILFVQTFFYYF